MFLLWSFCFMTAAIRSFMISLRSLFFQGFQCCCYCCCRWPFTRSGNCAVHVWELFHGTPPAAIFNRSCFTPYASFRKCCRTLGCHMALVFIWNPEPCLRVRLPPLLFGCTRKFLHFAQICSKSFSGLIATTFFMINFGFSLIFVFNLIFSMVIGADSSCTACTATSRQQSPTHQHSFSSKSIRSSIQELLLLFLRLLVLWSACHSLAQGPSIVFLTLSAWS